MTDRATEMEVLRADAARARRSGRSVIRVLTGTGGVGKTALAAAFLDQYGSDFPDGPLIARLGAFSDAGPADPVAVLGVLLAALGEPPADIPAEPAARSALFQERTAGRGTVLLLDDAASAAQVLAVLPGEGPHLVLITTRLHLSGLLPHGARTTRLGVLDGGDATELVVALTADLPQAVARSEAQAIADLCGRLPLALCAAAGRLLLRPERPAGRTVADLRAGRSRLDALSRDLELSVRAAFDASCSALSPQAFLLYRLLSGHPAPEATADDASALLGADAAEEVDELLAASLLEDRGERVGMHDLVRAHAAECARSDPPEVHREALDRLAGATLRTAVAADRVLAPHRWRLGPLYERDEHPEQFSDRAAARTWLTDELPTIAGLIARRAGEGHPEQVWQLCEALWGLFTLDKHFDVWTATHRAGIEAADGAGLTAAAARMRTALAAALLGTGDPEGARSLYTEALPLWEEAGHALGTAAALEGLGVAALSEGCPAAAVPHFRAAVEVHRATGHTRGIALGQRRIGEAHRAAGQYSEARRLLSEAAEAFGQIGDDYMGARTAVALAEVEVADGGTAADASLDTAETAAARAGAALELARVRELRGRLAEQRGDVGGALEHYRAAAADFDGLGAHETARVKERAEVLQRAEAQPSERDDSVGGAGVQDPDRPAAPGDSGPSGTD